MYYPPKPLHDACSVIKIPLMTAAGLLNIQKRPVGFKLFYSHQLMIIRAKATHL